MLIPTLELLVVSFVLGVLITGLVLVGLQGVEAAARLIRHHGAPSAGPLPLHPAGTLRRPRESSRSRAA
jgi:hypothetical protein